MSLRSTLLSLLVLALSPGCSLIEADEPDKDSRSDFHDVTVTWHLRNLDGTVMTSCPPGFTTLVTHLYVAGYVEPADAILMTPCTPEGSLTQPVATAGELREDEPDGTVRGYFDYTPQKDIWIDLTEETQSEYAAVSYTYYVEALTSNMTIDFDLYPEGGVGVGAWMLQSSLTSAPLTSCATAGVDEIEAAVRAATDDETVPLLVAGTWPCDQVDPYFYYDPDGNTTLLDDEYELGSGHTRALAPNDYYVEMRAKRAGVIVGRADAYFTAYAENGARLINGAYIPIDDR